MVAAHAVDVGRVGGAASSTDRQRCLGPSRRCATNGARRRVLRPPRDQLPRTARVRRPTPARCRRLQVATRQDTTRHDTTWKTVLHACAQKPAKANLPYDTIRDDILTFARMPTWVSLIYRTETTAKKCKTEKKLKSKKRICSEVTVKVWGIM